MADDSDENDHDEYPSYIRLDELGRRQGRLLSLNGYTQVYSGPGPLHGQRYIDQKFMDITVAAFLAWKDFQDKRGHILSSLPTLLRDCDFQMTFSVRDPKFSRREAIRQALEATVEKKRYNHHLPSSENATTTTTTTTTTTPTSEAAAGTAATATQEQQQLEQQQPPFAVVGPLFSSVTKAVNALLGGGMGVAQISGEASSDTLNNAPLFSRTVPNNNVHARATMAYLYQLGVTRAANLHYVADELGTELHADLAEAAKHYNITLLNFAIERNTNNPRASIRETLSSLRQSQAKYVIAVLEDVDYKEVVRVAYQEKMMGLGQNEFAWFMVGFSNWADPGFRLVRRRDEEVAKALHGVGMIHLHLDQNTAFNLAQEKFAQSTALQQEFVALTQEPERFQNYTFRATSLLQQFQYFTYDAVIAMGLTACNTPGFFTGSQLHDNIKGLEFLGVTGPVHFDATTGIRSFDDFVLHVDNIVLSDNRSTATTYRFDSQLVAVVRGENVTLKNPFIFSSNSTIMPPVYPPLVDYDFNLIPLGLQIFGLCMGGLVVVLSLGFLGWTHVNRNKFVVSAGQPVFLCQLCIGTIIMATSIIPSSMQGIQSTPALDAACMSIPWLFFLGLCTAISAILCKTWRLEQILDGATSLRRVQVKAADVVLPFVKLLLWNLAMLIGWTIVSPQHYERIPLADYDSYGRSKASTGLCVSDNDWSWFFRGFIIAADLIAVLIVCKKCYKVRKKSSYFAETKSLAWSIASLTETTVVFSPLLIAAKDNPSALYAATAGLVSIACLSLLLPIFLFKIFHKNAGYSDAKDDEKMQEALAEFAVSGIDSVDGMDDMDSSCQSGRMNIVRLNHGQHSNGGSCKSTEHMSRSSFMPSTSSHHHHPSGRISAGLLKLKTPF